MSIKNILTLVINHHYYKNGCCQNFLIQPDTVTSEFFRRNKIGMRYFGNMWKLFIDVDNESLWVPVDCDNDKVSMRFTLSSTDDHFYTSIENYNEINGINCVCNKNNEKNLKAVPCVEMDCVNRQKQLALSGKMNWTICLGFEKSTFLTAGNVFYLSFEVKYVYWKYIVFNSNELENIKIIDPDSTINFISGNQEEFPYGKKADIFISDKKIPLSEIDKHNFRLIIKKGGIEKNLIKRLPVATASGIQFKDSERKELVSLLFINT